MTEEKIDALSLTDDEDNEDSDYEPALPELQGTLSKWTNYLHGWQDRFIVLKEGTLSYYKSENDTSFGCRGAVSLAKASVSPHQFDECRFDVNVNDCVWYLRANTEDNRQQWISAIELHRQAESGYGSENNLRRHGSMISLTSGASLSTTSTSSFKRGRGLREKLAEMETFRDILCRQIDTLQSYFDSCASAVADGSLQELHDDIGDPDDLHDNSTPNSEHTSVPFAGPSGKDLECILKQHGGHAVDFKGESFTFKATTAGIIATLSHCMELMSQREEAWRKRLEREVERRKKFEEAYKTAVSDQKTTTVIIGGPDFEEGPHCNLKDDEFYDAVDASLDILDEKMEEEIKRRSEREKPKEAPKISLSPSHRLYNEINSVTETHLKRLDEKQEDGEDAWQILAEEGELKVYKMELEVDGVVMDPLKACHVVKGITGHEVCHYFWDLDVRMEWDLTLESCDTPEVVSNDTIVTHNVVKRVWPTSQRDALFWSHIRHVPGESDETPDRWMVINYSTDHPSAPANKYVRVIMNIAMICETIIEPPTDGGEITRDNIKCKINYLAEVNPGGWAPASVLRAVYKREYPKFLKRFTGFVAEKTKDKPILF